MKLELESLLDEIGKIPDWYHTPSLRQAVTAATASLSEPVNIGIVGLIKAGKSTFVNALIGDHVARVGNIETTYNVCKYQYGSKKSFEVVHHDGAVKHLNTLDEVLDFTIRNGLIDNLSLNSIDLIRIDYPSNILKQINILDTPGLSSVYETDEENTKRFIQSHGDALSEITVNSLSTCDAVLYLFSKGVHQSFSETLKNYVSHGDVTPLRSVGILSKVDMYFDVEEHTDVMPIAQRIMSRLYEQDGLNKHFHSIMPLCGRLASGCHLLNESDVNVVSEICDLPCSEYVRFFRAVKRLSDTESFTSVDFESRNRLVDLIGLYGIYRLTVHYQNGVRTLAAFKSLLLEDSGIVAIRTMITGHFGARRTAIKAKQITDALTTVWAQNKSNVDINNRRSTDIAIQRLQNYSLSNIKHNLDEVAAIRVLLGRSTLLSDDVQREAIRILGGYGSALDSRIDVDFQDHFSSAIEHAINRLNYWRQQLPIHSMLDRDLEYVTTVVIRSYEKIAHRLKVAQSAFAD